eukprot:CAMPEP_0194484612 /NCGR_PEP_ID=MMETSP0253-20130528/5894_1 /TAXON_ID=2966 /ORGANISM="Noctiluca scintillans" /LENGTH=109 /DNA_ID=CAMNT_0039324451 /DNA_START=42 /DNA_END=367 /DNA_ORIENTATION=-
MDATLRMSSRSLLFLACVSLAEKAALGEMTHEGSTSVSEVSPFDSDCTGSGGCAPPGSWQELLDAAGAADTDLPLSDLPVSELPVRDESVAVKPRLMRREVRIPAAEQL